ncbi:DUF2157 domain-containing protein [Pseudonocardiaceae bacterium YIM PH 21723]|nr:DUF2157 domain-containing protein [Pseudonocardiaceae bacterium YIM PH 21723]
MEAAMDIEQKLKPLVDDGTITAAQADAVQVALRGRTQQQVRLPEILAYVGGALLISGSALALGIGWQDITHTGRILVLAAATAMLAAVGLYLHFTGSTAVRERLTAALFTLAAAAGALTAQTIWDHDRPISGGLAGVLLAVLFYRLAASIPTLLVAGVAGLALVFGLIDYWHLGEIGGALLIIAVGVVWAVVGRRLEYRGLATGIAGAILILGAQYPISGGGPQWISYAATALVGAGCFLWYRWEGIGVLLAAGILAITIAVPEAVWDLTGHTINAALLVVLTGAVVLAASAGGLRVYARREATESRS